MLHCLNASGKLNVSGCDMSSLERQRARMKWQQDQNFQRGGGYSSYSNTGLSGGSFCLQTQVVQAQNFQGSMVAGESLLGEADESADHELGNVWTELGNFDMPCLTSGVAASEDKSIESSFTEKISCNSGRESFNKRKAGSKFPNHKIVAADYDDKKIKVSAEEEESKITQQDTSNNKRNISKSSNRETSDASKETSKVSEVQKPDYIHVRARRGQATDSHSLAERVRREKISERMKCLQDLVPGCNKMTGKAGMLDEIINYVQSLQRQVEFLSMKLSAVNPRVDFNMDDLFAKEVLPPCPPSFPDMGMSDMADHSAYLQFNQAQQMTAYCGMEMGMNNSDMSLTRTANAPVFMPETFVDSSCYSQMQPFWESALPSSYNAAMVEQGRSQSISSAVSTYNCASLIPAGSMEACHLKGDMT